MLGPRGTVAITWPIVPVPGDCEDGEVGGMKWFWQGKPKYSERTCPDSILSTTNPTCPTRAAAVGSQRLSASAMARPKYKLSCNVIMCTALYILIVIWVGPLIWFAFKVYQSRAEDCSFP
jgi:hypothetical protein